jgi:hypothetical protein
LSPDLAPPSSDWGREECGGLAAAELLKKKEEETEGKEETESVEGLSGALERGEEGGETETVVVLEFGFGEMSGWNERIVDALVLILSSIEEKGNGMGWDEMR